MSTNKHVLLATVEEFEAGAFRVGQVARRLMADHPDLLMLGELRPVTVTHRCPGGLAPQLEITVRTTDDVAAWAKALGTAVEVHFHDEAGVTTAFEFHETRPSIDGVDVWVTSVRRTTEEETTAWQAKTAAKAGGTAGGGGE